MNSYVLRFDKKKQRHILHRTLKYFKIRPMKHQPCPRKLIKGKMSNPSWYIRTPVGLTLMVSSNPSRLDS